MTAVILGAVLGIILWLAILVVVWTFCRAASKETPGPGESHPAPTWAGGWDFDALAKRLDEAYREEKEANDA